MLQFHASVIDQVDGDVCLHYCLLLFGFLVNDNFLFLNAYKITSNYQEDETTLAGRTKSDAREMQNFYQHYYRKYIQALQNAADKADR